MKHKVFISYHHANDQYYKEELLRLNEEYEIFIDMSVDTGDISDDLPDESIRTKIRDEYLKNSSVTILLVGTQTKYRKHIDWEIYSSMYDGKVNKKSGILVIQLPTIHPKYVTAPFEEEKTNIYNYITSWTSINERTEYKKRYPCLAERIIDNLMKSDVKISVTKWEDLINNPNNLKLLIDLVYKARKTNNYDLSRPMKRKNINDKKCRND